MSFRITILGTSGALPAYGRFPTSQLLEIQNRYFLVDCGEGTQMQMMRFQANFHRISHIFISHLHGDHYLGLMGLLFTMHLQRRTNDLHLYSHPGLDEIITTQLRYSQSTLNFRIHFHRLEKGVQEVIYEDEALTVEAFPLHHKIRCSGFLFREKAKPRRIDKELLPSGLPLQQLANLKKGLDVTDADGNILYKNKALTLEPRHARSYAFCSDTAYYEPLIARLQDIDLLYHESTFIAEDALKAMETFHSTATHAAMIAKAAGVKKLLLGHFSARYRELDELLAQARQVFDNSYLAVEGETFVIDE